MAKQGLRVLDRGKPNPYADELEIPDTTHVTLTGIDKVKQEINTQKHVVVPKYTLHVDDHGIYWGEDKHRRVRTLRIFDKATEDAFWTMDVENKSRFLRDYMDNVDQWIIEVEMRVTESWVERQKIRDEFTLKVRKWEEYLQSFRMSIENVADKSQYKKYRTFYDQLRYEFDVQVTLLENATEMSYWKAFREFWAEIKKAFSA